MRKQNLVVILSDEHAREVSGCYGSDFIKTPNIDSLARRGTVFNNAYTNCPICVPSRASLATGKYVHQIRHWDNSYGYTGDPEGWGHELIKKGHAVTAIGKLHYRSKDDENGWSEEVDTLHVVEGIGDLYGMLRDERKERSSVRTMAENIGPGNSTYIDYDARVTHSACDWLSKRGAKNNDNPWVLYVGFVLPHFPLIAPPEYYDMYPKDDMPPPRHYAPDSRPKHPALQDFLQVMDYDRHFDEEKLGIARSAYYGMISYLDHNVGQVLKAIESNGLAESTRIIYSSDHGDNMGHHGFWGKSVMYEESVGIPLIMAGHGVQQNQQIDTPVSLVDFYPTILESCGVEMPEGGETEFSGHSLFDIANGATPERVIFSEYHAVGSSTGFFMIRHKNWKYVYYPGYPPQLFDLDTDPTEGTDLAENPDYADVLAECDKEMRKLLDPDAVNAQAFADQAAKIEECGGADTIRGKGEFPFTPVPGENPGYEDSEALKS